MRPKRLADFVGQEAAKENLSIAMRAARIRGEPLDHVIIYGPPGLGKTTLALIIAQEMDVEIKVTSGPAIERPGDMAAILTRLNRGDVLFIDEVHRLSRVVEEILYSAMEDFFLSWMMGKGLGASNVNLRINPFTLIGATTRFSMVSAPLRDRFGSIYHLDYYEPQDMGLIVERSARILQVDIEEPAIEQVALRSRGTPRVANRLIKRCRDYALVVGDGVISGDMAQEALEKLEVDPLGLDRTDHRLLAASSISSLAGQWAWILWQPPSERKPTLSWMSTSLICSSWGSWTGRPAGGWPLPWPIPISTGRPKRKHRRPKAG